MLSVLDAAGVHWVRLLFHPYFYCNGWRYEIVILFQALKLLFCMGYGCDRDVGA